MALIKIEMSMPPVDGMDIKFKAPCDCTAVTGILVEYPEGSQEYTFRDSHGNNLAGIGNLFGAGAYVKVTVDTQKGYAYLQNADNNGFLNSGIFGTYTHDGENLVGSGENGKFKATASGTISAINVNGVACSVKCGEESSMDLIAGCWYTFILDGDTVNFNSGGAGGGGLNFQVIGSLQPPVSPKENDIWINTDTPITGYDFNATQPADSMEGMVWIAVGTSSPVAFNALKRDSVMVYPLSAKQYIGGAWVSVEAKSYQDGAWVDWFTWFYRRGDEFTAVTGGWVCRYQSNYASNAQNTDQGLYAKAISSSGAYVHNWYTKNMVDVSKFSTLHARMRTTKPGNCSVRLMLLNNNTDTGNADSGGFAVVYNPTANVETQLDFDISNMSGVYYIKLNYQGGDSAEVWWSEVWAE
jgi:hypothetical protein